MLSTSDLFAAVEQDDYNLGEAIAMDSVPYSETMAAHTKEVLEKSSLLRVVLEDREKKQQGFRNTL